MKKYRNRTIRIILKSQEEPPAKVSLLESVEGAVTTVLSVIGKGIAIVTVVVATWWVAREYLSSAIYLDEIHIPDQLLQMGYNPSFFQNGLVEEIESIRKAVSSDDDHVEYVSIPDRRTLEEDVFGINMPLNDLFDILFKLIGREKKLITCELINSDRTLTTYLHLADNPVIKVHHANANLDSAFGATFSEASYEILRKIDPTVIAFYCARMANRYRLLEDTLRSGIYFRRALEASNHLTEKSQQVKWSLNLIGHLHTERREPLKAIPLFQQAIALDSGYVSAYNNLGIAYFHSKLAGKDSLAMQALLKANEVDDGNTYKYSRYNLGKVYTSLKDYQKAVEAYKTSLAIDPGYARAYNNLGYVYRLLGKTDIKYYDSSFQTINEGLRVAKSVEDKALLFSTLAETMFYKQDTTSFMKYLGESVSHGLVFRESDLMQEPYKYFRSDSIFLNVIHPKPQENEN